MLSFEPEDLLFVGRFLAGLLVHAAACVYLAWRPLDRKWVRPPTA